MCMISDREPCEVWNEYERKARKPHVCDSCWATIAPGTFYLVHFNVFEGRANAEKMCLACRDDRAAFAKEHEGMLMEPSQFRNDLYECIGEGDDDERWKPMLVRIDATMKAAKATPTEES